MISIYDSRGLSKEALSERAEELYLLLTKKSGKWNLELQLENLRDSPRPAGKIPWTAGEVKALNYIIKHLKRIITSPPDTLEKITRHIEYGLRLKKRKELKSELYKTFRYENFRDNGKGRWLCNQLGAKSCIYCASQYMLTTLKKTIKSKKTTQKLLFEFDHFYAKSDYPYLSVSFYNLIPVCSNCNRSKGKSNCRIRTHYHPYHGTSLNDIFTFSIDNLDKVKHAIEQNEVRNLFPVNFSLKFKDNSTQEQVKKFDNHEMTFALKALYQCHSDIAVELVFKSMAYPPEHRGWLEGLIGPQGQPLLSKEEIERLIVGNYVQREDYFKRPLAKFMTDLAVELDLITI